MLDLRKIAKAYEEKGSPISELVPWMLGVSPGMVLNKDGSLLACFTFAGIDREGKTQSDVDYYASLVEHAFRVFDERITIWWRVDRRRTRDYPEAEFPDAISRFVDQERRKEFDRGGYRINRHWVCINYTPPGGASGLFQRVSYYTSRGMPLPTAIASATKSMLGSKAAFRHTVGELREHISRFEDILEAFCSTILMLKPRRVEGEELLTFLKDCCSPASEGHPVKVPSAPLYLDSYLPENAFSVRPNYLKFDDHDARYVTAMSVKDWPRDTEPGLFDALMATPGDVTISQVFRFVERERSHRVIQDIERHNRNMQKSLMTMMREALIKEESAMVDSGRLSAAENAAEALESITTSNRVFGYYNLTVLAYGDTAEEAGETMRVVSAVLRNCKFIAIREKMHLLSAWAGTMPGQWAEIARWFFIHNANLADLSPVRVIREGNRENAYFSELRGCYSPALTVLNTEYGTPVYFNFHLGDVGHAMILGPTGAGKSVFMNFCISQYRKYAPANCFIFDKDRSCRIATLLQGGQHIDVSADGDQRVKINPLKLLASSEHWDWLGNWIEDLLTSRDYKMQADDDKRIRQALEGTAKLSENLWRLRTVAMYLPKALQAELEPWIGDGPFARYFDNEEDSFDLGNFTCIEMGEIMTSQKRVARAFMNYAFRRIEIAIRNASKTPTFIYIEECWFLIEDPVFGAKVRDFLKTLRKAGGFVGLATQSLADIKDSPIFATIIDNVKTRIFLPNPQADAHREVYMNSFGLNEEQVRRIRTAQRNRQYYIVNEEMSRLVETNFSRETLAVLRSDKTAQECFDRHRKAGGDTWQFDYVKEMSHA